MTGIFTGVKAMPHRLSRQAEEEQAEEEQEKGEKVVDGPLLEILLVFLIE
jgi:hypothetical protein